MAIKLICGSFLVVVLLGYLAEAKTIIPPPQSPPTQRQKNQNNPISQNPYNPQVPGQTQIPHDEEFYSCEVVESQRIGCGETGISQSECERINCCYGPRGCFFGKAATLHCNANGDIILVVARDATVPSIEVNSISLMGDDNPSCSPHVSTAFIVYKFNANQCGTQVTDEDDGVLVYQNKLSSTFEIVTGENGVITRDTVFELDIQCRYSGKAILAIIFKPLPLPDPLPYANEGHMNVELRLGNGKCLTKGCVEDDVAFNSFYSASDYPVPKVLREYVYVEVRLLDQSNPDLHLNLGDCWVTPDPNPYTTTYRWDLLRAGCPNPDDTDRTKVIDVDSQTTQFPTHHKRFAFKMFTFVNRALPSNPGKKTQQYDAEVVDPLRDQLYIHCECDVCIPSASDNCRNTCFGRKKRDTGAARMTFRKRGQLVTGVSLVVSDGV